MSNRTTLTNPQRDLLKDLFSEVSQPDTEVWVEILPGEKRVAAGLAAKGLIEVRNDAAGNPVEGRLTDKGRVVAQGSA